MGLDASLLARYWAKVEKHDPDCSCCQGCWLWRAAVNSDGYGVIRLTGRDGGLTTAHRLALVIDGRDPGNFHARHSCDTPACVNPAHLTPGTQAQNMGDAVERHRHAGERNGAARLTPADVLTIRARVAAGETQESVREDYGIAQPTISGIVTRARWTHL